MIELVRYHEVISEAWHIFRKYAERAPLSGPEWDRAIEEMTFFPERHSGCERIAGKLMIALEDELERMK